MNYEFKKIEEPQKKEIKSPEMKVESLIKDIKELGFNVEVSEGGEIRISENEK